jgi:hypothetical protein
MHFNKGVVVSQDGLLFSFSKDSGHSFSSNHLRKCLEIHRNQELG